MEAVPNKTPLIHANKVTDEEWKVALGAKMRAAREAAGYDTLRAFVEAAGIDDYNRASRYERGRSEPRIREFARIAKAAGVNMESLIDGSEPESIASPVFDEWIRSYPGAMSPQERMTLAGVRFIGLKPTPAAYTAMLAALRMCDPGATTGS